MAHLDEAFRFIVPKYRFHSNQAFMVIDNRWQAQDHYEPRTTPCITLKYPASGNDASGRDVVQDWSLLSHSDCTDYANRNDCVNRSPSAVMNDWVGLPPVKLPYMPPANLGLSPEGAVKAPMFLNESPVCGATGSSGCSRWCSSMDTCDNVTHKFSRISTANRFNFKPM